MRRYLLVALLLLLLASRPAVAQQSEVSLGGFIPYVGITLTNKFKNASTDLTGGFFLAEQENQLAGSELIGTNPAFKHDIALLDTGAATHILTSQASGTSGFRINGNGFAGTNTQQIGGATGLINLSINDPLGFFASGLGNRTSAGVTLEIDRSTFRGQSSVATLSAPTQWELPNIVGLPMAAQHKIVIRNDQPQVFAHQGRTVRTPQVEFKDLGSGNEGILRRTDLRIRPGAAFISGPLYIQNLDLLGGNFNFHDNPLSPTVVENGGLFVEVDMQKQGRGFEDKEFLFDTGADFTVVSSLTAARLGFDPLVDTPDFILEVEGSGGVQPGVPGFYLDELNIDTVGGSFTLHNVPVAVLDVTNPNDPGNTINGIIGMHLFNGRNLVIDANPSIGQGGAGPSLYISDPVTTDFNWATTQASAEWQTAANWSAAEVPDFLAVARVASTTGGPQVAVVSQIAQANTLTVGAASGSGAMTLRIESGGSVTTFGETKVSPTGILEVTAGALLDAQFVNIYGGTLRGGGEIFSGTGPVSTPVRNVDGRVEPGDGVGRLTIDGDFSNLIGATVSFELAGTTAGSLHDQLDVSRFAFLGGTLEIQHVNGFVPTVGDMFTLITADKGISGTFDNLILPAGFQWDLDYNEFDVTLSVLAAVEHLAGDFNGDGTVDAADYTLWRNTFGSTTNLAADADGDGIVGMEDYDLWKSNFGQSIAGIATSPASVPEPATVLIGLVGIVGYSLRRHLRWPG